MGSGFSESLADRQFGRSNVVDFTTAKPGGRRDDKFAAYTRLREDIAIDVSNVPRGPWFT